MTKKIWRFCQASALALAMPSFLLGFCDSLKAVNPDIDLSLLTHALYGALAVVICCIGWRAYTGFYRDLDFLVDGDHFGKWHVLQHFHKRSRRLKIFTFLCVYVRILNRSLRFKRDVFLRSRSVLSSLALFCIATLTTGVAKENWLPDFVSESIFITYGLAATCAYCSIPWFYISTSDFLFSRNADSPSLHKA